MTLPAQSGREGRLAIELRVIGAMGAMWWLALVQAFAWTAFTVGIPQPLRDLPWSALVVPHVIAGAVAIVSTAAELPATGWTTHPRRRRPSLPLMVLGFPTLPIAPFLWLRHRRAQHQAAPSPAEVAQAFHALLRLPRSAALRLLFWGSAALLVDAIVLAAHADWPRQVTLATAALWVSVLGPMTAVLHAWVTAIVRPACLSAPFRPTEFSPSGDLRLRMGVSASIVSLSVIAMPLLAAYLWQTSGPDPRAISVAETTAMEVLSLADGTTDEALGELLGGRPDIAVRRGSRRLGHAQTAIAARDGLVDRDGAAGWELLVRRQGDVAVAVPLHPVGPPQGSGFVLVGLASLLAAVGSLGFLAQDVHYDVLRATAKARAMTMPTGGPHAHVPEFTFATFELRRLVGAVDELLHRVSDANVAKYVAIERAKEVDRLKSQFLANMSHDLRSPLNSILGFSELLLSGIDGELTPEQRTLVQPIYESGRALLREIDDILDTAKIEAGRLEMHPEPTPPTTIVNRAIQAARKSRSEGIEYRVDVAPGLPPVFVDPYRTVQAMKNVLLFAAERMDEGAVDVVVRQGKTEQTRAVFVDIVTPVRPATAEQLARARRGFYRIPGHRGLGLGLPIAGSILELQGGALGIEDLGAGMAFSLQLAVPRARRPSPTTQ